MTEARTIQRREVDEVAARFLTGDAAPPATRENENPPAAAPAAPAAPAPSTGEAGDLEVREHLATLEERLAAVVARGPVGDTREEHPLAQYRSLGEYAQAVYHGDADPGLLERAWADQTVTEAAGVMPPSWSTEVHGIVDLGRRMITGTGGPVSAGDSGMSLAWPYFDGDLAALVGEQAANKTEITSVKVALKKGTADLRTFAGGSDVALQIIERSSPAYLDAYMRIMAAAYAYTTDAAFTADLVTAAGAAATYDPTKPAEFIHALVTASLAVEDATGQAPSVVGIGHDLYAAVAGMTDSTGRPIFPAYGATNADGVKTSRGGLTLDLLGIPGVPVSSLAGKIIVTNGAAARWAEDGPRTISAPEVAKLGRDVAVYGYGDTAAYVPAGVKALAPTTTP